MTAHIRHHSADSMPPELDEHMEPVAVILRPDGSADVYGCVAVLDQRHDPDGSFAEQQLREYDALLDDLTGLRHEWENDTDLTLRAAGARLRAVVDDGGQTRLAAQPGQDFRDLVDASSLGTPAARRLREDPAGRHEHTWIPVASEYHTGGLISPGGLAGRGLPPGLGPYTRVLAYCTGCGKRETWLLAGHWTDEQIGIGET